jgi:sugar lactone lactonase YvrE
VASSNDIIKRFNGTTGEFIDDFVPFGTTNLADPQDLVFHDDNKLYISNSWSASITRENAQTGAYIDTLYQGVLYDFIPQGMAFGADGNLYVADSGANAVLRFDVVNGGLIDAFVAPGAGGLNQPEDVLFGIDGNLLVTSYWGSSVLRYDGVTGEPLGTFAIGGGLQCPTYMLYVPEPGAFVLFAAVGLISLRRR